MSKINKKISKDYLVSEMQRYHKEYGKNPTSAVFDKKENPFPSRKTYEKYFGSFGEALKAAGFEYMGWRRNPYNRKKPLPKGITDFTKEMIAKCLEEYVNEHGVVPLLKDIERMPNYPSRVDFRKLFGGYNNALIELGYKPRTVTNYSDDELKKSFFDFVNKNNRVPRYLEFNNSEFPSFWCYQNRFGSWNKAVEAYGFEPYSFKSIEELKSEIIAVCSRILKEENRNILTYRDFDEADECTYGAQTYFKNFKKHADITLREFLKSIGFELTKAGLGMYYEFDDGEYTKSSYEFQVSRYFRKNNIDYERDVKYRNFVIDCKDNKNCDYVVSANNKTWYIEIAGMLNEPNEIITNSKVKQFYKEKLEDKIRMFEDNKLNYIIVYPIDFKSKSLDEIFSFLNQ